MSALCCLHSFVGVYLVFISYSKYCERFIYIITYCIVAGEMLTMRFKTGPARSSEWRCCFCLHVRTATILLGIWHLVSFVQCNRSIGSQLVAASLYVLNPLNSIKWHKEFIILLIFNILYKKIKCGMFSFFSDIYLYLKSINVQNDFFYRTYKQIIYLNSSFLFALSYTGT